MKKPILPEIKPQARHNYVAFFLTLACNLRCPYCINQHNQGLSRRKSQTRPLNGRQWLRAINRLSLRPDLPLTLQGGEPTLHKDFYLIAKEAKPEVKMDLLTNMAFDADEFIRRVPVERFTRTAPYAAIRASYHPGGNDISELIEKTRKMQDAGFRVGIYGILHPDKNLKAHILEVMEKCLKMGIDFRTKEFLGNYKGTAYGTFKYRACVNAKKKKSCLCRSSELIADPAGFVYRCHADLYLGRAPVAHILDEAFSEKEMDKFRECSYYGDCNPCDVKVKTNRYQIFGHTSVQIKDIRD
jgi:organic radical activating enzyme